MNEQLAMIKNLYRSSKDRHEQARQYFNRPLNLAQKILSSHIKTLADEDNKIIVPGKSYVNFYPDRISMQDATAQMALLQFISTQTDKVRVPTTVHCDHLIEAHQGANNDLKESSITNREVYDFLRTASAKYGIGFFKPGSGIIHQVVLESYAFPGGMMIGTDSHTPNGGGLGMIAIGVGGADAVDVMVGGPLLLKWPKVIGVKLSGQLSGWASPKDIILQLMSILTVKGGTGHIVEFFGDGAKTISATGKATIANMGAEHGATCSLFPFDQSIYAYLSATDRKDIALLADEYSSYLKADIEVYEEPHKYYDQLINIDLDKLKPHISGPHSPDLCRPVSLLKEEINKNGYLNNITAALIGSCTNSSYEDIARASSIAQEAYHLGLKAVVPFYISPGSETVYATVKQAGFLSDLEKIGGVVLANACGPCIGQWRRDDIKMGEKNTIVSSYNRNFPGRNDGNRETLSFLTSPEIVVAMALAGNLSFDPENDELKTKDGQYIKLSTPKGEILPKNGLSMNFSGLINPPLDGRDVVIAIDANSERLSLLKPFLPFDGKDMLNMPILLKAVGKCTTDHISQAGKWLKFRGHLDKIANNTYIGALNAFSNKVGIGVNVLNDEELSLPDLARYYQKNNMSWVVIADENFGEGSSREHAAMQPRHLGAKAIIVKSFARIHENNLKKHGLLPLTFKNNNDYDKIEAYDRISIVDLANLAPGKDVVVILHHNNGQEDKILTTHTMSLEQISWFKAGSALNALVAKVNHQ